MVRKIMVFLYPIWFVSENVFDSHDSNQTCIISIFHDFKSTLRLLFSPNSNQKHVMFLFHWIMQMTKSIMFKFEYNHYFMHAKMIIELFLNLIQGVQFMRET